MTQKILSHPLSLSSPAITFRTSERPWCRTFARPLLLNHQADWPPDTTAAVIALRAITAAPSPEESDVFVLSSHHGGPERVATASGSSLHPQHRLPLLLFLPHKPRAPSCRAFPLNSVSWFPRLHRRGPTPSTDPSATLCTSHWGCHCLRVAPSSRHKHTTINGALVCFEFVVFMLHLRVILIWFVWLCFDVLMLICCMRVSSFVTSDVSIRFRVDVSFFCCTR